MKRYDLKILKPGGADNGVMLDTVFADTYNISASSDGIYSFIADGNTVSTYPMRYTIIRRITKIVEDEDKVSL